MLMSIFYIKVISIGTQRCRSPVPGHSRDKTDNGPESISSETISPQIKNRFLDAKSKTCSLFFLKSNDGPPLEHKGAGLTKSTMSNILFCHGMTWLAWPFLIMKSYFSKSCHGNAVVWFGQLWHHQNTKSCQGIAMAALDHVCHGERILGERGHVMPGHCHGRRALDLVCHGERILGESDHVMPGHCHGRLGPCLPWRKDFRWVLPCHAGALPWPPWTMSATAKGF